MSNPITTTVNTTATVPASNSIMQTSQTQYTPQINHEPVIQQQQVPIKIEPVVASVQPQAATVQPVTYTSTTATPSFTTVAPSLTTNNVNVVHAQQQVVTNGALLHPPPTISAQPAQAVHNVLTMMPTNAFPPHTEAKEEFEEVREQDRYLPIANIARIMKNTLPENAKIAKDSKETVQECVSEFISFITSEASDKCIQEKRKTINGDDLLWAMSTLGFDKYVEPLKLYLTKYREAVRGDKAGDKLSGKRDAAQAGLMLDHTKTE